MRKFLASVRYGDWEGTSAADSTDKNNANNWLQENGYKRPDEFLIGITMFSGENHGKHEDPVFVEFLLAPSGDYDIKAMVDSGQGPVKVRRVKIDMPLIEFFGFFKRFSITLSFHGMLGECDYTYDLKAPDESVRR